MEKPPQGIGIPKCTCKTLEDGITLDPEFDSEGNCNYHDKSSPESIEWITSNLINND